MSKEFCISVGGNGSEFIHADTLMEAVLIYIKEHLRACDDPTDVEGYEVKTVS